MGEGPPLLSEPTARAIVPRDYARARVRVNLGRSSPRGPPLRGGRGAPPRAGARCGPRRRPRPPRGRRSRPGGRPTAACRRGGRDPAPGRDAARGRPAPRRPAPSVPSGSRSHEVDRPFQAARVDHDAHEVAVAQPPDRPAGERLGGDVADAGPGGDAGEARIGHEGHALREVEVAQRRRDLVDLLHARPARADAGQHQHLARRDRTAALPLDGGDGGALAGEDVSRADVPVDAVGADRRSGRWPCSSRSRPAGRGCRPGS